MTQARAPLARLLRVSVKSSRVTRVRGLAGIRVNSVHPTVVMTPMGKAHWDPEAHPERAGPMLSRIPLVRRQRPSPLQIESFPRLGEF